MRRLTLACVWLAACDPNKTPSSSPVASVEAPASTSASAELVLPIPPSSAAASSASPGASASAAPVEVLPCPPEMANAARVCVDRWEAHLVELGPDGAESVHPHTERPEPSRSYAARSASGVFPQGYVSRVEADAACRAAGKRLCTLNEWTRACKGPRWTMFPYGGRGESGRCNTSKDHLLSKLFGTNGRAWKYDEHFNSPRLNAEPGFLEKAGERERCVSSEGVHDMVGNLHEWVSDSVTDELVERLEKEPVERKKQPWHEGNGVFMGGFFSTTKEHGPGCSFITIAHEPRYHDYSTGFRCCKALAGEPERQPKKKRPRRAP